MRPSIAWYLVLFLLVSCTRWSELQDKVNDVVSDSENALTLRLLLETKSESEPEKVADNLSQYFDAPVQVERLFPDVEPTKDPEGLAKMFVARVPPQQGESPWDTAYAVRDELQFEHAEPDRVRTLEEGLESAGTCTVENEPPQDHQWSLEKIRALKAWDLTPPTGGSRFGEGIRVCHPDTGWSDHDELGSDRLDLDYARNLLKDGTPDAKDPLEEGPFLHPGHGTATGTVIVSSREGTVSGVAGAARLVPIRTAKSVIQVFDSDLARAIHHAVTANCDVISMSLGGRAFFGLKAAIRNAIQNDVLVMAAAGNCVRFVVAPASYDDCLAVGGINIEDLPWRGSSRGRAVDISAPAEHVWTAKRRSGNPSTNDLYPAQGTSFAVANVAGAAALWLAYYGPEFLKTRYPDSPLQDVFREQLRRAARRPNNWDSEKFGAGILDVEALLEQPLLDPLELVGATEGAPLPEAEALIDLSRTVDRTPQQMVVLMAKLFQTSTEDTVAKVDRWAPELIQLALENPPAFEQMLKVLESPEERAGSVTAGLIDNASGALKGALQ